MSGRHTFDNADAPSTESDQRRLNGVLDDAPGTFLDRRLYVSSDGERWFIEFNDADVVEQQPAVSATRGNDAPPHTIYLKPDARIFEGRFSTVANFLEHGVVRRIRDDGADDMDTFGDEYDDWFIDAPSRGIGCELLRRG